MTLIRKLIVQLAKRNGRITAFDLEAHYCGVKVASLSPSLWRMELQDMASAGILEVAGIRWHPVQACEYNLTEGARYAG